MNDSTVVLVGGDDKGQDAAVNDELHAEHLVVWVQQVGLHQWFQNRFVRYILCGKFHKSSSCLS